MGVTIHYQGTFDDPGRIEEMEDRVTDLVFALGGRATIWRSYAEHDPSRIVRGLMIEMAPGQETFSLLVSPDGHLTPILQIEEAEQAPFDRPPFCCVKTQFGSLQGHVAIVHLLDALKQGYCSNLEVSDEGAYFENRDVDQLIETLRANRRAIDLLADGLEQNGLSKEAAEDPNILATRIERVAMLVHRKMAESGKSEPVIDKDARWDEPSLEEEVDAMDAHRRRNDLRSERMSRRVAEATASGMTIEEALELAMLEEGLGPPSESNKRCEQSPNVEYEDAIQGDEPWMQSLPANPFDEASDRQRRDNHPAVIRAQDFLLRVMKLNQADSSGNSFFSIAARGAMDVVGGLVQATCDDLDTRVNRALAITQLKRALAGHAFARGAIFGLRNADLISDPLSDQLLQQLAEILKSIHKLSDKAWDESS